MQFYRSYYYLFALQQQIQALIYNRIQYPYIEHEWIRTANAIFLVRDFYTNQLRYDSTENLSIDWYNQGAQSTYLVPFSILNFADYEFEQHPYLKIITADQPILIVRLSNRWYCLLPCLEQPSEIIDLPRNIDPRDYSGFLSSQHNDHYMLFTMLSLEAYNLSNVNTFTYPFDWTTFSVEFLQQIYPPATSYLYTRLPFKLINNLAFEDSDRFLLKKPPEQVNIGFSLWQELNTVSNGLLNYQYGHYEKNEFQNLSETQRLDFYHYQQHLEKQRILLVCHLANQHERAFMDLNTFCNYLKQHNVPVIEELNQQDYQYRTEIEKQLDESTFPSQQMRKWKELLHLIIFLLIVFLLFYGVYWLSLRFAFINWLLWILGGISLLAIITRK